MYKNILVAFDGSEYSKAALIESSKWVKRRGGKITLVHAVYFDEEELTNAPEYRERRFKLGKEVCYQTKDMVLSEFGVEVESLVCEGEPSDVIVDIAKEKKADLISIGTHGRKGIKRLIMGSVTSKVIVNAPCDVMVVKSPCTECTGEYKSILVPFDGSEFSKKALGRACKLSKIDNAEITVLYVIPHYEEMIEFLKTESIKKGLSDEAQKIIDVAKEIASGYGIEINTDIRDGHAGEKIIESAKMLKNDLIVAGAHGWRGINKAIIGSTTESVIANAFCPVLVVGR